jgi:hypothetical protein
MKELDRVRKYYDSDPLQKRFSALVQGETGSGKTFLLRSARFPVHIDSFDPGGTKCLRDLIKAGHVVADTTWENEDPFNPTVYAEWKKTTEIRLRTGYFKMFGTYALDSLSTFGDAVMNYQLGAAGRPGEAPRRNKDYMPQKIEIQNYIKKLMTLDCDFILTAHLREHEDVLAIDSSTGIVTKTVKYRLNTVGQAVVSLPLLFDELYVLKGSGEGNPKRNLLLDSLGKYIARSRLKADGRLGGVEDPNIKNILKKIGLDWEDKPRLRFADDK